VHQGRNLDREANMTRVIHFPNKSTKRVKGGDDALEPRPSAGHIEALLGADQHPSIYIADMALELFTLARKNEMDVLAYLLKMASEEARCIGEGG
jgi:hypothetical protein